MNHAASVAAPDSGRGWMLTSVLLTGMVLWLLAVYGETAFSLVEIWTRSETFAHGFLIFPISAYLIWAKRKTVAAIPPQPDFRALAVLGAAGFGWLAAGQAGAVVVQQYSLVVMIPLLVWLVLGSRTAAALTFPLLFLLFAVPVGEFLLPTLMMHTADFTVFALRLTGIPVYREGLFFTIPSGQWSVVEACSGLRYLIASATLGCLYAYLTYRSFKRRAIFIALSLIVPVFANWLRAYMIVMIGHLSGMQLAVGVDHLIYGWVFFGMVMLLMFWIGSFWREDQVLPAPQGVQQSAAVPLRRILVAALAGVAVAAAWPAVAAYLDHKNTFAAPPLAVPQGQGGWSAEAGMAGEWTPHYLNSSARIKQAYGKGGKIAGLFVAYYNNQRQGRKLITTGNMLAAEDEGWKLAGERVRDAGGHAVREAQLHSANARLLVWQWYWVEGTRTASPYAAKLLAAKSRLLGRGDDAAAIMLYAPYEDTPQTAAQVLNEFAAAMLPAVEKSLHDANRD